jgi:hypothetical protein
MSWEWTRVPQAPPRGPAVENDLLMLVDIVGRIGSLPDEALLENDERIAVALHDAAAAIDRTIAVVRASGALRLAALARAQP